VRRDDPRRARAPDRHGDDAVIRRSALIERLLVLTNDRRSREIRSRRPSRRITASTRVDAIAESFLRLPQVTDAVFCSDAPMISKRTSIYDTLLKDKNQEINYNPDVNDNDNNSVIMIIKTMTGIDLRKGTDIGRC